MPVTIPTQVPVYVRGFDGIPDNPDLPIGIQIIAPTPREIIDSEVIDLFLDLRNYSLGNKEEGGNAVHVILDNQPPQKVYDIDRPLTFSNLAVGGHTIRVFAVRPDGTMFPDPASFDICHFFVKRKDFQNYVDPSLPYLTLNLPSDGIIDIDEEGAIVFDYFVHHANATNGFIVRYDLSGGYIGELKTQGPVYWRNLTPGKHRLKVDFLDRNGRMIPGPFNQVEREFIVRQVIRAEPVVEEAEVIEDSPVLLP
ncbi:MAG: hypothetical protein AAFY98_05900 [Verrucomicrobiota bacterium]